jgi:hypothetical protein
MQGREFLALAQELLGTGTQPCHWRAAIIHAYYALMLECREAMTRWGLPRLSRQQVHAQVRLRLQYATDQDLKDIGSALENLGIHRNLASYDVRALPLFASAAVARKDEQQATAALALLDAIDADPARRMAAAGSIRP